jgi:hypothetical protein
MAEHYAGKMQKKKGNKNKPYFTLFTLIDIKTSGKI